MDLSLSGKSGLYVSWWSVYSYPSYTIVLIEGLSVVFKLNNFKNVVKFHKKAISYRCRRNNSSHEHEFWLEFLDDE